jgi:hypothetical protein
MMLVLLCCGSLAFSDLAIQWKDHFVDNRNKWSLTEDAASKAFIKDGKLCLTSKQAGVAWNLISLNFDRGKNFKVKAQVTAAAGPGQSGYGLIWELSDAANFSALLIAPQGWWAVIRMRNGKTEAARPWTATTLVNKDGTDNLLEVERSGTAMWFSVNGKVLGSLQAEPGGPYLGLIATGAGDITSDYMTVSLEAVYQGEILGLPEEALPVFVESLDAKKLAWPVGDLGGTLAAAQKEGAYVLSHSSLDRVDIVTRRVELDTSHDFCMEASISKTGGADNTAYGLVFNRKGDDRWVFALAGNGQFTIYRFEAGKRIEVQAWTQNPNINKYEGTNVLSVWRRGDTLSFGINGRLAGRMKYIPWAASSEAGFSVGGDMIVSVNRLEGWRLPPTKGPVSGDCVNGWGMSVLDTGAWYIGSWKDGVPEGLGTKYSPGFRIEEGVWEKGAFAPGKTLEDGPVYFPFKFEGEWSYADVTGKVVELMAGELPLERAQRFRTLGPRWAPDGMVFTDFKNGWLAFAGWKATTAPFSEGLVMVTDPKRKDAAGKPLRGFIDGAGQVVIEPGRYSFTDDHFEYGLCGIMDPATGLCGFINRDGSIAVPPIWASASPFSEGLCAVMNKKYLWGFIDRTGRVRIEPMFAEAQDFHEGLAYVRDEDGNPLFIDSSNGTVFTPDYGHPVTDDASLHFSARFSEGRVAYMDKRALKWGYLDAKGNVAVKAAYNEVRPFSGGLAAVNRGGRFATRDGLSVRVGGWGFIDTTGREVIPCGQEEVGDFACGLAPARVFDLWGFLDEKGQWAIKPAFASVEPFEADGWASVTYDKSAVWIDRKGALMKLTYPEKKP